MTTKTFDDKLPSIAIEGSLSNYLTQIKKFPMLSSEEEYMLARRWRDRPSQTGDYSVLGCRSAGKTEPDYASQNGADGFG